MLGLGGLLDAFFEMIPEMDGDAIPLGQRALCVLPLVYRIWASARMMQLGGCQSCSHGQGGDRDTRETPVTKLEWPSSDKQWTTPRGRISAGRPLRHEAPLPQDGRGQMVLAMWCAHGEGQGAESVVENRCSGAP